MQAGVLNQGVETARNLAPDPRCVSVSNYRVVGTLSSADESGVPFIRVRRNLSQSGLYVDPLANFTTSGYGMNVGDTVSVSAEIRVTKAFDVQVRINTYSGAAVTYLDQPMVSLVPSDGWVRVSATATVSTVSGTGYLRAFIRAFPDNADAGHGFDVRRYMVTLNNSDAGYFDGSTPANASYTHEWSGTPDNSASVRRLATSDDVIEYSSRVIVNGIERPHISWSVDREIANDMPEGVSGGGGVAQATGTITWAAEADIAGMTTNPWYSGSGWLPKRGDKVQIFAGDGTTLWSQFVGIIDRSSGSVGGQISSTIIDRIDDFSTLVNIPAMLSITPPLTEGANPRRVGLSNIWYSNYCLRSAGFYSTPGPEYRVCLDVPLQGSMWPMTGLCLTASAMSSPDIQGETHPAPWGTSRSDFVGTYDPSPNRPATEKVQIMILRDPNHTGVAYVRCVYPTQNFELRITATTAQARLNGVTVASCPTGESTVIEALIGDGTVTVKTNGGATASGAGSLTGTDLMDRVEVSADANARVGAFQVSHPSRPQDEFASISWVPSAIIRPGSMHTGQQAIPAQTNRTARDVLDEMSKAILRPFWIDELGVAQMVASDVLRGQSPAKTLTTVDDIFSLDWEDSILAVRKEIRGSYDLPSVTARTTPSVTVWEGQESIVLQSGESQDIIVEPATDEDWILTDETLTVIGGVDLTYINHGRTSFTCGVVTDGVTERYATPNVPGQDWMDVSVSKLGENTYKVTHTAKTLPAGHQLEIRTLSTDSTASTALWPMWWGKTMPFFRAYARTQWTKQDLPAVPTGSTVGTELEHDFGPWATSFDPNNRTSSIDALVAFLAEQTAAPHPLVSGLRVAYDPRLQLGDVVNVSSPNLLGVTLRCLVTGVSNSASNSGFEQSLSVRIVSVSQDVETYSEFNAKLPSPMTYTQWETLGSLTQTYADFNVNGE